MVIENTFIVDLFHRLISNHIQISFIYSLDLLSLSALIRNNEFNANSTYKQKFHASLIRSTSVDYG